VRSVITEAVGEFAMALDVSCQRRQTSETANATHTAV